LLRVRDSPDLTCGRGADLTRRRVFTNLAEVTHDTWQTFVLEVGLGCSDTGSWRLEADVVDAIVVGCCGPAVAVNNGHGDVVIVQVQSV
jgi:hypothetical protein